MPWNPDGPNIITLPNGEQVEIPAGISMEQARQGVIQQYPELFPDYEAPSGFFPAIHSSWENIKGAFAGVPEAIGAGTPLGGTEEQRKKLLEGAQRTYSEYAAAAMEALPDPASRESIGEAYDEGGLWGAIPETGRFAREALGQQVPIMGGAALAQRLGASKMVAKSAIGRAGTGALSRLLPAAASRLLPAAFSNPWTGAMAATALFAAFAFSDMLRDQTDDAEELADIDPLRAAAFAAPHAAMEYLGFALMGAFGPLKQKISGKVLKDSLSSVSNSTSRTALGAAGRQAVDSLAEFPTEMAQTVLERAQAGESISPDDAGFVNSILDTAAATVPVVGVLGSYGSYRAYKNEKLNIEKFKKLTEDEQRRRESNRVARQEALDKDEQRAKQLQRQNVERWNRSRSERERLTGLAEQQAESEAKFEPVTLGDVLDSFDSRGVDAKSKGAKAFILRNTEGRAGSINQLKDLPSLPAAVREQRARDRRQVRSIMSGMKAYEYARTPGDLDLNMFTQEQFEEVVKNTRTGKITTDRIRKILNDHAKKSGYNFGNSQIEQDIAHEALKELRQRGYASGSNLKAGLSARRPGFTESQYQEILRQARENGRITQEMYELTTNNFGRNKFQNFIDDVRVRGDLPKVDARDGVYVPTLESTGIGQNDISIEQSDGYFIRDGEGNVVGGATTLPEARAVRKHMRDLSRSYSITRNGEVIKTYKSRSHAGEFLEDRKMLEEDPDVSWELVPSGPSEMVIDKSKSLGWRVVERYSDEDGNVKDVYEDSFVPDEVSARERLAVRENEYRYGESDWDIRADKRKKNKFEEFMAILSGLGAIPKVERLDDVLKSTDVNINESEIAWPEDFNILKKIEENLENSGIDDDVTIRLIDALGEGKIAAYEPTRRIIFVSLNEMQKAETAAELEALLDESINHETIHALKDLDLFTENEWIAMARTTARIKITPEMVARDPENLNENMSFLDHAALIYGGGNVDQILESDYLRDLVVEEAIANLYGSYRSSPVIAEQVKGNAKTLLDRIKIFLERLYNALSGTGYGDAGHVFMALTSEATAPIAKRERGKIRSIPPLRQAESTAYENLPEEERRPGEDFQEIAGPPAPRRRRRVPTENDELIEEELETELEAMEALQTPDETARYIATKAYPIEDGDQIEKIGERLGGNDSVRDHRFYAAFNFEDHRGKPHKGVLEATLDSNYADPLIKENRPGFYYTFTVDDSHAELGYAVGGKSQFRVLATAMDFMQKLADGFGAEVIRFTADSHGPRSESIFNQLVNSPDKIVDENLTSGREKLYRRAAIEFARDRGWNVYQNIEIDLQSPEAWRESEFDDPERKDALKSNSHSSFVLSKISENTPSPRYSPERREFLAPVKEGSRERTLSELSLGALATRVEDQREILEYEIGADKDVIATQLLRIRDELGYRTTDLALGTAIKIFQPAGVSRLIEDIDGIIDQYSLDARPGFGLDEIADVITIDEPSIITHVYMHVAGTNQALYSSYILPLDKAGKQENWPEGVVSRQTPLSQEVLENISEEIDNVSVFRGELSRELLRQAEEGPDDTAKFMITGPRIDAAIARGSYERMPNGGIRLPTGEIATVESVRSLQARARRFVKEHTEMFESWDREARDIRLNPLDRGLPSSREFIGNIQDQVERARQTADDLELLLTSGRLPQTLAEAGPDGTAKFMATGSPSSRFMDEYHELTYQHPFDNRSRTIGVESGGREYHIETGIRPVGDDTVRLSWIQSNPPASGTTRGAGVGSYMLKRLTDIADKHGVSIEGTVARAPGMDEDSGLSVSDLKDWYVRNGFEITGGPSDSPSVIRRPVARQRTAEAGPDDTAKFMATEAVPFVPRIYDGPEKDLDVRPNINNRTELTQRAKAIANDEIEGLKYMATSVVPSQRVRGTKEYEMLRHRHSPVRSKRSFWDNITDILYGEDGKMEPGRLFQYFRQKFVDKYAAIAKMAREANERRLLHGEDPKLLASVNAAAAAYLSDKASGVIAQSITSGQPVYVGGITRVDFQKKGLFQILRDVYHRGLVNDWHLWMLSKRDVRFDEKEGKVTRTTPEERAIIEEHLNRNPEIKRLFEKTNAEYQQWNENLVNYMVDTGVINREMGEVFKQFGDYIPFYREFEGTADSRHRAQMSEIMGQSLTELRKSGVIPEPRLRRDKITPNAMFQSLTGVKGPKRATGGRGLIVDPLEGIMRNLQAAITSGMKNVAGQRSMRDALLMEMAERVDTQAESNHSIRVNGEDLYFDVKDPLLHDALTGMMDGKIPMLSFFSGPSWLLRELVTRSPDFIVANLMRDSISTWATSGTNMTPFVGTIKNFFSGGVSALDEPTGALRELIGAGVAGGGYDNARVTDDVFKIFNRRMRKEGLTVGKAAGFGDKFMSSTLGKIWDWSGDVTTKSDAATRMAVYQDVMSRLTSQGVSRVEAESEAIYQAMEVINFSRRGNSMIARVIGAAIPFLNARVQGLDVLWRTGRGQYSSDYTKLSGKQSILKFIARGSTIATMTGLYALLVHDDDEWKNATPEEQDDYWILPGMGDGLALKIPIPFEIGVIFKVIPERFMRHFIAGEEIAGIKVPESGYADRRQTAAALERAIISTFEINPFGIQAIKPVLEAYTNHSFFTGRPIIPIYMENMLPREQYRDGTNAMAVSIGNAFNASPMDVEHVLRGYTGTVGSWVMMAIDEALRTYGTMPERASFREDEYPLFRRFLQTDLGAQGPVNDFYSLRADVRRIMNTINDISGTPGRRKEAIELGKKYEGVRRVKPIVDQMNRQMAQMMRYQKSLMESDKSPEQKRKELDKLDARRKRILSRLPEIRKKADLPYFIN